MYIFDNIFMELVNVTFSASWLIVAVIFFRLVFRKCPKWVNCLLWLIVAVRLICPFSFESEMSLVPQKDVITDDNFYYSFAPTIDSGINIIDNAVNPIISDVLATDPASSVNASQIFGFFMGVLWLLGVVCMLMYSVLSYLKLRKKVSAAAPLKDNMMICDDVKSPFILGFIKPRIYLPSDMSEENLGYVIAHEQAHIKRKDYLWKPLGFILLSVYWFNPLMWISFILLSRDIELACDEKVIKSMEGTDKKRYTEALFSCSAKQKYITACPVAFGEVGVKKRIKAVLSYKKPTFWLILLALVASLIVAVCFMTDPKDNDYILKLDEYEISSQDIKFYAFVSDGEYFYQAYDEETVTLTNEILSEVNVTGKVFYNLTDPSKERVSKRSLVAVPMEGESVFLYFDETFETLWCCDVDGNYSDIYSFSGGEKIKALFEEKGFINEEAVWTCNPMLSASWHYQINVVTDDEIVSATSSMGEIKISDDKKSFLWSSDNLNPSDPRESAGFEVKTKASSGEENTYSFTLEAIGWEENLTVTYYRAVGSDNTKIEKTSYGNYKISSDESSDTAEVSDDLNAAVSKAILDINSKYYWSGECAAEGHIIFTTKEKRNKVTVYLVEDYASFGFENGYFMSQSGHRIPAVMTFEKTDSGYEFLDVEYAEDGSGHVPSVKRMFPKEYESRALSSTDEDRENLWNQCVAYAEKYLEEIGREAEIYTYGDIDHVLLTDLGVSVDVSNKLSGLALNYNSGEVGFFEKIENGVRYIYKTSYLQNENVILYTKEVYGTKEIVERIEIDSLTGNVISTTSVPAYDAANDTYFDAKVLAVEENMVLVEPFENSKERNCADKIRVSTDVSSSVPVPDLYDDLYIRIFYDGMIEETYPAKIPNVSAIYLYADANYIGNKANQSGKPEPTTRVYYIEPETTAPIAENTGETVGYTYLSPKDTASLVLTSEDKTFTFMLSYFSSYLPMGTYEESGSCIILKTDDGKNTYTFEKKGTNLVFLAEKSSPVPEYKYDGANTKAVVCIPDKAEFRKSGNLPEDFDINFTFGIELDNVYDTYNNTLKKDMVSEDDVSVNFEPSEEDLNRIHAKILELDITSIEKKMTSSVLSKTDEQISVTPLNQYNIKITMNGNTYYVNGDTTASYYKTESDEANRFCQFTAFMTELYQNTPEYKSLPAAVGAYS